MKRSIWSEGRKGLRGKQSGQGGRVRGLCVCVCVCLYIICERVCVYVCLYTICVHVGERLDMQ